MQLHKLACAARSMDRILSRVVMAFAILLFLFGGFAIWDNMRIERNATTNDFVEYKPSKKDPQSFTLGELKEINPDVAGWITVSNTHIDYPVVRGEDNMEYVNKDIKGEFSYSGSIFMDSRNSADLDDSYIVLYGHHMNKDGMFSDVSKFLEQDYLESHQEGYLFGEGFVRKIHFFACCPITAADAIVYSVGDNAYDNQKIIEYAKLKSRTYIFEGDSLVGDVIGLSTCAEATSNKRYVLFGIMDKPTYAQDKQYEVE